MLNVELNKNDKLMNYNNEQSRAQKTLQAQIFKYLQFILVVTGSGKI